MAETIVTVTLCVKGEPERAKREAVKWANKWYTKPPMYPPPGEGYPEGTLLHYTIQSAHEIAASKTKAGR